MKGNVLFLIATLTYLVAIALLTGFSDLHTASYWAGELMIGCAGFWLAVNKLIKMIKGR